MIAEIVLLGTLHNFHERVPGYSYQVLNNTLETLRPDVLCVELESENLAMDPKHIKGTKTEYREVILGFAQKRKIPMVALEPSGKEADQLLASYTKAWESAKSGPHFKTYEIFTSELMQWFISRWKSPVDVVSLETSALFAVKHRFQSRVAPGEEVGWEKWNEHFAAQIVQASKSSPGKRIIVTVGVEHIYWLQDRLKVERMLKLVPLAEALSSNATR